MREFAVDRLIPSNDIGTGDARNTDEERKGNSGCRSY